MPAQGLGAWLDAIRGQLDKIATVTVNNMALYQFAIADDPDGNPPTRANEGNREKLEKSLKALAVQGRALYVKLFPDREVRKKLAAQLAEPGQTIHVARVAEGEVVPWALMYDLDLDPAIEPKDVCPAPFNDVDDCGRLKYRACGGAGCVLTANNRREIVCPWGFWGYKHILEQPAQQVRDTAAPRSLTTDIGVTGPIGFCMNVNTQLKSLAQHEPAIQVLVEPPDSLICARRRCDVLKALKGPNLHIIYFYCHAGITTKKVGWEEPYLAIGEHDEMILPASLQDDADRYYWPQHPLVFINACESAGLTPKIMGSFIQVFAEQGAAGVIGTEVKVWEPLATAFARQFFEAFLDGQPVGWILRDLRLKLLQLYNPLGLIYTNYCSADLHLVRGEK